MSWRHCVLALICGATLFGSLAIEPIGSLVLIAFASWIGFRAIQSADYAAKEKKK